MKAPKIQDEPQKIIETLREKITWLELEPECIINISELAQKLGVSRTPIKEALINLEAKGWLKRQNSHFTVTPLSLERMREVAEVRSVIEIQAYIWAMQRITDDELKVLKKYKEKIICLNKKATKKEILQLDISLHVFFFKIAKNRYVYNLLERSIYHALRFWLSMNLEPTGILDDMLEMIDAFGDKDEIKLRKVSSQHIKNWADGILGSI